MDMGNVTPKTTTAITGTTATPPPTTASPAKPTPPNDAAPPQGGGGGGGGGVDSRSCPGALATYEEVVADAALFMQTLGKLHRFLGTKFMVPTIGGKALDLHRLFVEVTCRGGLEKVIAERKWREIIAAFHFPSTITSASFVLRKYYLSLLHAYEQVYFFQNKDSKISVSDGSSPATRAQSTTTTSVNTCAQKNPPLQPGCLVTGKIKGKFENGYVITANFGSEILRGVLYHVPLQSSEAPKFSFTSEYCNKKRSRKAMKDPSRPKSHRSGYNFFFAEQCAKLKPLNSREERAIRIGDMWNKLSTTEKEVYQQKGIKDVERYRIEMMEYKKSTGSR